MSGSWSSWQRGVSSIGRQSTVTPLHTLNQDTWVLCSDCKPYCLSTNPCSNKGHNRKGTVDVHVNIWHLHSILETEYAWLTLTGPTFINQLLLVFLING